MTSAPMVDPLPAVSMLIWAVVDDEEDEDDEEDDEEDEDEDELELTVPPPPELLPSPPPHATSVTQRAVAIGVIFTRR